LSIPAVHRATILSTNTIKILLRCEFKANGFVLHNATITIINENEPIADNLCSVHKADTVHGLAIIMKWSLHAIGKAYNY
jgi:hypothetical protein